MGNEMKKFVFDVIGSEDGMKSKMVAEFNSFADKHGLSEKDIRGFVEIIFNHSFRNIHIINFLHTQIFKK